MDGVHLTCALLKNWTKKTKMQTRIKNVTKI